jgi:hypothetical protein
VCIVLAGDVSIVGENGAHILTALKLGWASAAQRIYIALEQRTITPPTFKTMELPSTSDDQIAQFQAEYQAAFNAGSQDELEAAKCR